MIDFDDPNWRSPATGSTAEQIMVMREEFRVTVLYVNKAMMKRYAFAAEERKLMKQLEEEQKTNDDLTTG